MPRYLLVATLLFSSLVSGARAQSAPPETKPLHWYKGNTHTHTLWSDGNEFPEMVVDWYQKHGYQFLAISDHNTLHAKEVWMGADTIQKRTKNPEWNVLQHYRDRFGDKWVQTREEDGKTDVRLKMLKEYRPLFEKPGQFLLVQAEEISAGALVSAKIRAPIHINAVNVAEVIKPQTGSDIRDVMRRNLQAIHEQEQRLGHPIFVHINHPNFQWALTAEDLAEVLEENYFEVYNGHPKINYLGDDSRMGIEMLWDTANTLRIARLHAPPLRGMATDDAHGYHGEETSPGRGWVMVHAAELTPESLIGALRRGDFYGSSGVTLDSVAFDNGTLRLRIHAEPGVHYTTRIIGTPEGFDETTHETTSPPGDAHPTRTAYSSDIGKTFATITGEDVTYPLTGKELYVRAVITSDKPHANPSFPGQTQMAWTQPVGWEKRVTPAK
jgi:hypothetical protein